MAAGLGVTPLTALLLANRGLTDSERASEFFNISRSRLYDPFLLNDMDKAALRVLKAVENREKIMIYGDYDADGVTSVSILRKYLASIGGNTSYHIPSREKDGYGVSIQAIDRFSAEGVNLIITVDTGITAIDEARYAGELGIDMVITDHHECREILPEATAVVNPKRTDSTYPFSGLAGVGVAFKFICAAERMRRPDDDPDALTKAMTDRYIDLVAIGTIADVMPLTDENRILVSMGLEKINGGISPALRALLEESGSKAFDPVSGKCNISSSTVSFTLAPRINAAGRMESADLAAELFLTDDQARIKYLAGRLCAVNGKRQEEENRIVESAAGQITAFDQNDKVIILADDKWSSGIIGIVASRITERYGKPTILISFDGDTGRGSGRSIEGVNLVEALSECSDLLTKYGGHSLAAGLTIERNKLDDFRKKMNETVTRMTGGELPVPTIEYEASVNSIDICMTQLQQQYRFEPFGVSNPAPVYRLDGATVVEAVGIGGGKHTRLTVEKDGLRHVALFFGRARERIDLVPGEKADMLFTMSENDFRGNVSVQMIVRDIRLSQAENLDSARARLEEIQNGAKYSADENILPTREETAAIYRYLRDKCRTVPDQMVNIRELRGVCPSDLGYIKTKLIIGILSGAGLISVTSEDEYHDLYKVGINYINGKIDIERLPVFMKLKDQMI